jgi:hypothetical protein
LRTAARNASCAMSSAAAESWTTRNARGRPRPVQRKSASIPRRTLAAPRARRRARRGRRPSADCTAVGADEVPLTRHDEAGVVRRARDASRSIAAPRALNVQSVPCESDGVKISPKPCWTLYEPPARQPSASAVRRARGRGAWRRRRSSRNARPPRKVTCCGARRRAACERARAP